MWCKYFHWHTGGFGVGFGGKSRARLYGYSRQTMKSFVNRGTINDMSANLFAVIHAREASEALSNAELAVKCGMNGVFFISHGELTSEQVIQLAKDFQTEQHVQKGVNLLGKKVVDVVNDVACHVDMLWSDYTPEFEEREQVEDLRKKHLCSFDFYGGVAFKYTRQPKDLLKAAQDVKGFVDVLTTSGPATGVPPEIEKLAVLAEGFGDKIAVASGVTPENVVPMLPYVGYFLVATGISKDFHNLDEDKCKALVNAVRSAG